MCFVVVMVGGVGDGWSLQYTVMIIEVIKVLVRV